MDGRITSRVKFHIQLMFVMAAIAAGSAVRAQAMGKAVVDGGSVTARPIAAMPATMPAESFDISHVAAGVAPTVPVTPSPVITASEPLAQKPVMAAEAPKIDIAAVVGSAATTMPAAATVVSDGAGKKDPMAGVLDGPVILPPKAPPADKPSENGEGNGLEQRSIRHEDAKGETPASGNKSLLPPGSGNLWQVVAALSIVIGLIFIGRALARKFLPGAKAGNGKGVIEILARHPLAKNQSLVLVRIGSQIVALNQGKEASQSVLVISDATEVAKIIGQIEGRSANSVSAGFNNLLSNARMDLEENGDAETDQKSMDPETLDEQLEEMAAAKRQLMELRQHVRSVRDSLPTA